MRERKCRSMSGSCLVLILVLIACAGFTPIIVSPRICTRGLRHSSTEGTSASWPVIVTLLAHSHTLTANPRLGETLHVTRNAFHPLFQSSRAHVRPSHRAKNERRTSDAPSVGNKNRGISLQSILSLATSPHVWRHDTPRRLVLLSRKIPSPSRRGQRMNQDRWATFSHPMMPKTSRAMTVETVHQREGSTRD